MNTFFLILFLGVGALFVVLGIPLIRRKVPPNHWYGMRVRQTLENEAVWYPANEYAGWQLLWLGIVTIVLSVALYLIPALNMIAYVSIVLGAMLLGTVVMMVRSFIHLQRLTANNANSSD